VKDQIQLGNIKVVSTRIRTGLNSNHPKRKDEGEGKEAYSDSKYRTVLMICNSDKGFEVKVLLSWNVSQIIQARGSTKERSEKIGNIQLSA
jgi:hypothetical protein